MITIVLNKQKTLNDDPKSINKINFTRKEMQIQQSLSLLKK